MNNRVGRIIFDIALLISIGLAPWWATALLAVIGAIVFPRFYELIIAGGALDALYGTSAVPIGTITALMLFILLRFVRGILRVE